MNKLKIKLLNFLIILLIFICNTTYSNGYYNEVYSDFNMYDYYIKNMDVQVEVNDKREYIITETIDVYFNEYRHGLLRNIPFKSTTDNYKIKDIYVDGDKFSISSENPNVQIKIGDENEMIQGDKKYIIKYTLKHYDDGDENSDYMYLNVLGTEWDVPIVNFTSTITYPKEFNFMNINITSGSYGSTSNEYASYTLDSNKVHIKSKFDYIHPNTGITVKMNFEEGAFCNAPKDIRIILVKIMHLICILLFVITIVYILKSRKKLKKIPKIIEFYPPDDINSVEMAYIYNRKINNKTVVSLLYNWASKGYIKIEMSDSGKITLIKLKDLDKADYHEEKLFETIFLFGSGNPIRVSEEKLEYKLGQAFTRVKDGVKEKYNNDNRYNLKTPKSTIFINIISIIILMLFAFIKCSYIFYGFFEAIFMAAMILPFMGKEFSWNKIIFYVIIAISIITPILFLTTHDVYNSNILSVLLTFLPILNLTITTCMIIPEKKPYEQIIYGRIAGFKEFIETAEKDRLEMLLKDDDKYFYRILPYAQALNVTKVWTDKFKNIAVIPSENYSNISNSDSFSRLSENISTMAINSTASSSSSSGGDSGGCSGGGSGGGGGSSW